jgi:hypothetical protein
VIKHSNPIFQRTHNGGKLEAWKEVVEWCGEEIIRLKKAEKRAGDDIGAYSMIRQLERTKRVFKRRASKIQSELVNL